MASGAAALLSDRLKRCLAESGIRQLNPVQEEAIPAIHEGKDALLIAPTAGGKTEAAVLPLLERAADTDGEGVRIVYVAPLRALLNDIEPRISRYAEAVGLRTFKWHGDVSRAGKRRAERAPPEVLLITPESIEVILVGRRSPECLFGQLQAILVDEVHYFAGSGRGAHLLCLLARLERIANRGVQRVGLSATVGNPERILRWLARGSETGVLIVPQEGDSDEKEKSWEVLTAPPGEIAEVLLPKLVLSRTSGSNAERTAPRSIVFSRSRRGTEEISRQLESRARRERGVRFKCRVHHGSVGKDWREAAETEIKLRDADSRSIVATSTLELGIDLGDLDLVGEAGGMSRASSFLQRVGRAGRRPGKAQWFVSVNVRPPERDPDSEWSFLKNLAILNLGARGIVEDVEPIEKPFHVLAQQVLAISVSRHGFQRARDLPLLLGTSALSDISEAEADETIGYMLEGDYLRSVPPNLVIGEQGEKRYLQRNALPLYSVFDTPREFTVLDGSTEVGMVDAGFVVGREPPFDLRLAGRNWRVVAIATDRGIVKVKPGEAGEPPRWWSMGPGTSRIVVEETARLLGGAALAEHIRLDRGAEDWLEELRRTFELPVHEPRRIEVRSIGGARCPVGVLGGDRVTSTLALWLKTTGAFETADLGPTGFVVERPSGDPEPPEPLEADQVSESIAELMELRESDAVGAIASMFQADETYNKFAPCVPPALRRLHLSATITDIIDTQRFCVE